jgi:hydroxyethylthiazole kinase-like uncharacterized protein yjeF
MPASTDPTSSDPTPVDDELLRRWPLPEPGESKYSRGDVLVVGGSATTPGAAMLAGLAALRAGAGRLTLAVAEPVAVAVAVAVPEAAVVALPEGPPGARLEDLVNGVDAVLIGPGLDDLDRTTALMSALLPRIPEPVAVCLDAYALAVLAESGGLGGRRFERLVLTPNKEEARVLLGDEFDDLGAAVRELAVRYAAAVTCYEMLADRTGRVWRGRPGSAGLGTSGSGDVLAGLVAGLLARGAAAEQAAVWGSYVHTTAGERRAARTGRLGYLARELLDEIPGVIHEIERGGRLTDPS